MLFNALSLMQPLPSTSMRVPSCCLTHLIALVGPCAGASEPLELRVIETSTPSDADSAAYAALSLSSPLEVGWSSDGDMLLPCQGGKAGVLRVQIVQPPTKKALPAKDYRNGVRKKRIMLVPQK
jgi:hypothetical protein